MKRASQMLFAALILFAVAGSAHAQVRTHVTSAYGGKAWDPSTANCFSDHLGSVSNSCTAQYWFTPLLYSAGQNATPRVYVYATGASNSVSCQNWASDASLTVTTSSWVSAPVYNTTTLLSPGTVFVPDSGHLFSWCYLQSGAHINTIYW
jgi:hypothetical protein